MYKESIQNTIDYVDANLRAEMTAAELAEMAGYSLFHFYRIFQSEVGMPVMQYILKRKLLNAIYEIGTGRKKIDVEVDEVDLLSRVRDWALPALKGVIGIDNEVVAKYLQAMDRLYPKLPKQIIHRDPNPSNVILSNQFIATAWFAGKEKFQSIFEVNVKMTNWILQNMELMKL